MDEKIELTPDGRDPVTEPAIGEELSEQQLADLDQEYQYLYRTYVTASNGMNPAVVVAALFSAAGAVAVQALGDEDHCRRYIAKCATDVILKLPDAFKAKAAAATENANGGDAGKEG